jgi:hypothetical protein
MATTTKSPKKKSASKSKTTAASKKTTTKSKAASAPKKTVKAPVKVTKSEKKTETVAQPTAKKSKVVDKFKNLRVWNLSMAFLHAVQGVLVLVLSQNVLYPVTTNYLTVDTIANTGDAPTLVPATRHLFDVNIAYFVVAFFFMSAIAHLSIATWYRRKYEANLQKGMNKARWIEYSLSASTMIIAIAMIAGIYDISTLLMMFGLTAVMNLCGLVMEVVNYGREKIDWSSYIVGCIAGALPWVVYAFYVGGSAKYGEGGGPPTFVYFILVSIFLFFNVFALNMWLQYKKKGKWADYLYGEKAYIVLSLVAKTALAWQVFAGTLRP